MSKILIIGPIPQPTTGVSLANKIVLENLDKNKFKVDYINTSYNKFDEKLGVFSLSKLFFFLKLNFYAFKIFKSNKVYITPGQTFFGVLKYSLFILLTKLLSKELIVHIHGNYVGREYELLQGIRKRIFKFLLSKSSKGIVLSESLTGNMTPFINQDSVFILYNFVEDYLFLGENSIKRKCKIEKPKIVFLSNLMEEKGIFELLESLLILEEKGVDYEAKIAGNIDESNKEKANNYFSKLKNTQYIGVVHGEKKKELLQWANTFVLATYYTMEGQPISILEAMATGNVVLTTKHAGIPDIFQDKKNGYFVEKRNAVDIANKIEDIIKNKKECEEIMLSNFHEAQEKYKVRNFANSIEDIFQK